MDLSIICGLQCNNCNKIFSIKTKASYDKHVETCGKAKLSCDECGKLFTSAATLRNHARLHTNNPTFPCLICGKVFRVKYKLVLHQNVHKTQTEKDSAKHKCEFCDKTFAWKSSLTRHQQTHYTLESDAVYTCNCGKVFQKYTDLYQHKTKCKKCKETSDSDANKVLPIFNVKDGSSCSKQNDIDGGDPNDLLHRCQICKKGFIERSELDEHIDSCDPFTAIEVPVIEVNEHEKSIRKNVKKNFVDKVMREKSEKYAAKKVKSMHNKLIENGLNSNNQPNSDTRIYSVVKRNIIKGYKSIVAKKVLQKARPARESKNKVDGYKRKRPLNCWKKYWCSHCNARYCLANSLKLHLQSHKGVQHFVCQLCKKTFNQLDQLLMHISYHNKLYPLKCTICSKEYNLKSNLQRHVKLKHQLGKSCDVTVAHSRKSHNSEPLHTKLSKHLNKNSKTSHGRTHVLKNVMRQKVLKRAQTKYVLNEANKIGTLRNLSKVVFISALDNPQIETLFPTTNGKKMKQNQSLETTNVTNSKVQNASHGKKIDIDNHKVIHLSANRRTKNTGQTEHSSSKIPKVEHILQDNRITRPRRERKRKEFTDFETDFSKPESKTARGDEGEPIQTIQISNRTMKTKHIQVQEISLNFHDDPNDTDFRISNDRNESMKNVPNSAKAGNSMFSCTQCGKIFVKQVGLSIHMIKKHTKINVEVQKKEKSTKTPSIQIDQPASTNTHQDNLNPAQTSNTGKDTVNKHDKTSCITIEPLSLDKKKQEPSEDISERSVMEHSNVEDINNITDNIDTSITEKLDGTIDCPDKSYMNKFRHTSKVSEKTKNSNYTKPQNRFLRHPFSDNSNLDIDRSHTKKEADVSRLRKYRCTTDNCGYVSQQKKLLAKHKIETHAEKMQYVCGECSKTFTLDYVVKSHIRMSHENKKYVPMKISNAEAILNTDEPVTEYVCTTCSSIITDMAEKSEQAHVCSPIQLRFLCSFCDGFYRTAEEAQAHLKLNHESEMVLGSKTDDKYMAMKSMRKEAGLYIEDNATSCKSCDQEFDSNQELRDHVNLNHANFPYVCGLCKTSYGRISAARRHLKTHQPTQQFHCLHCSMKFVYRAELERHSWLHRGERPCQCDICGNGYCDEKSLKNHYKLKHPEQISHSDTPSNQGNKGTIRTDARTAQQLHTTRPRREAKRKEFKDFETDFCKPVSKSLKTDNNLIQTMHESTETLETESFQTQEDNLNFEDDQNDTDYKILSEKNGSVKNRSVSEKAVKSMFSCSECDQVFVKHVGLSIHMVKKHSKIDNAIEDSDSEPPAIQIDQQQVNVEQAQISNTGKDTDSQISNISVEPLNTHKETPQQIGDVDCHPMDQHNNDDNSKNHTIDNMESTTTEKSAGTNAYPEKRLKNKLKCKAEVSVKQKKSNDTNPQNRFLRHPFIDKSRVDENYMKIEADLSKLRKYRCTTDNCGYVSQHKKVFGKHKLETHAEKMQYVCGECSKTFTLDYVVKSHIRMSHENKKYVPMKISNAEAILNTDEPVTEYVCTTCSSIITDMTEESEQAHVCSPIQLRFLCPFCDGFYRTAEEVQDHLNLKHESDMVLGTRTDDKYMGMKSMRKEAGLHIADNATNCKSCDQELDSNQELRDHVNLKHASFPYVCGLCKFSFGRISAVQRHLKTHQPSQHLQCLHCSMSFLDKASLERHSWLHREERPCQCDICGNRYCDERAVRKHIRLKHPEQSNSDTLIPSNHDNEGTICHVCGTDAGSVEQLKYHMTTHEEKLVYNCDECNQVFNTKQAYTRHVKQHKSGTVNMKELRSKSSQIVTVQDVYSGLTRKSFSNLKVVDVDHPTGKSIACALCNKRFGRTNALNTHIQAVHMEDTDKSFVCKICGRGFVRRFMLDSHMRIHTNSRPFHCRLCPKTFKQLAHIREHLRAHGKSTFKCRLCVKSFKTKSCLTNHVLLHCNIFPFKCPIQECKVKKSSIFLITEHCTNCFGKNRLTKQDSFLCFICNQVFQRPSDVLPHLIIHEKDNFFPCDVCDASFKNYPQLYLHKDEQNHFIEAELKENSLKVNNIRHTVNLVEVVDSEMCTEELLRQYDFYRGDGNENAAIVTEMVDNVTAKSGHHALNTESDELRLIAEQLTHMAEGANHYRDIIVPEKWGPTENNASELDEDHEQQTVIEVYESTENNASENLGYPFVVVPDRYSNYDNSSENGQLINIVVNETDAQKPASEGSETQNTPIYINPLGTNSLDRLKLITAKPTQSYTHLNEQGILPVVKEEIENSIQSMHNQNSESGGINDEYEVEAVKHEATVKTPILLDCVENKGTDHLPIKVINCQGHEMIVCVVNDKGEHEQLADGVEVLRTVMQTGKYVIETQYQQIEYAENVDNPDTEHQTHVYVVREKEIEELAESEFRKATETGKESEIENGHNDVVFANKVINLNVNTSTTGNENASNIVPEGVVQKKSKILGKLNLPDIDDKEAGAGVGLNYDMNYKIKMNFYQVKSEKDFPLKCNSCSKRFKTVKALNVHKKYHLPMSQRKFQCLQCDSGFHTPDKLKIHMYIHSGALPYKCEQCSKAFRQRGHLISHLRIHANYFPFECSYCNCKFTNNGSCTRHIKRRHLNVLPKKYSCKICGKQFVDAYRLIDHKLLHINNQKRSDLVKKYNALQGSEADNDDADDDYDKLSDEDVNKTAVKKKGPGLMCDICGKVLSSWPSLRLHRMKHESGSDFKCGVCGKGYATAALLGQHKHSHPKDKMSCEICGKMFNAMQQLKSHILRDHNRIDDAKYKCIKCNKYTSLLKNRFLKHIASCMKDEFDEALDMISE